MEVTLLELLLVNQFGLAFESNIWSIACVDRSDLGWSEPSDGFDYIKVWHKNKPINPLTGQKKSNSREL